MARGAPTIETCPTCGVEFTGSPKQRNGQGSWRKECPAGHWHTFTELARTRNTERQATRNAVMAKTKEVGVRTDIDAMRLALAAMLGGYSRICLQTSGDLPKAPAITGLDRSGVVASRRS